MRNTQTPITRGRWTVARFKNIHNVLAWTQVELLICLSVFTLLGLVALPLLGNTAIRSQRAVCANNLRQISVGFRAFAINNQGRYPWIALTNAAVSYCFRLAAAELGTPKITVCPSDMSRTIASSFTNFASTASLSYFINRLAEESQPGTWLAGDRNLPGNNGPVTNGDTLQWDGINNHEREGNICLVDGRLQQLDGPALRASANLVLSNGYRIYILKP